MVASILHISAGNLTSSNTAENITVSSSLNWGSVYTVASGTATPLGIAAAIGSSTSYITMIHASDDTFNDNDLFRCTYNGTAWSGSTVQIDGSDTIVRSPAAAYNSNDVLQPIYGASNFCGNMNSAHSIPMTTGVCRIYAGPSTKMIALANPNTVGTPSTTPQLAFFNGLIWDLASNPAGLYLNSVGFDSSGYAVALFNNNSNEYTFKRWNNVGSSWDQSASILTGAHTPFAVRLYTSASGAMGAFFSTTESVSTRTIKVVRRDTGGSWQSVEVLQRSVSGNDYQMQAGVDSGGKMVVVYGRGIEDYYAKIFNGSSWGFATSLGTSDQFSLFRVCSHRDSSTMFIAWVTNSDPQNKIVVRKVVSGVLDGASVDVHAPTTRVVSQMDIACNAAGEAVIVFYQSTTPAIKQLGAVIYGP